MRGALAVIIGGAASGLTLLGLWASGVAWQPSSGPDFAQARDLARMQHLSAIADDLAMFRASTNAIPDTGTAVETLCTYPEDAGCALGAVPGDPSGEGYWYTSDGDRFILFAARETDAVPACIYEPPFLSDRDLMCLEGP